jgi:hypothetical protein
MSAAFGLLGFASFIYECPQKFRTLHAKMIALVFTAQLNLRPHLNSYIELTLRYVTKLGDLERIYQIHRKKSIKKH